MEEQKIIFASMVHPGTSGKEVCIWAESLRKHGGKWANDPLWVMIPEKNGSISDRSAQELLRLKVQMVPYEIGKEALDFPYAAKAYAAAAAEQLAQDRCDILAMMDPDTIMINQPDEFLLPDQIMLAGIPVMLKWIGQSWNGSEDEFWTIVYQSCGVKPETLFPMTTTVDRQRINAYFNAGLLAVRPRAGVLRKWKKDFAGLFQRDELKAFYKRDGIYAIFIHQAVLAGAILSLLGKDQISLFSSKYNYPVMLYEKMPAELREVLLDDLVSLRYEQYETNPAWLSRFGSGEPLRSWLREKFGDKQN